MGSHRRDCYWTHWRTGDWFWLNGGSEPVKLLSCKYNMYSRRSLRSEVEIWPEIWLPVRTTIFKWWRLEIESGKLPKKLLKLRKRDLRSRRPERFGIGWRESFLWGWGLWVGLIGFWIFLLFWVFIFISVFYLFIFIYFYFFSFS